MMGHLGSAVGRRRTSVKRQVRRKKELARRLLMEGLEDRRLLALTPLLDGTNLSFNEGGGAHDTLVLRVNGEGLIEYSTNGTDFTTDLNSQIAGVQTLAAADLTSLSITDGAGNDLIDLSDPSLNPANFPNLAGPVTVRGGKGDDTFKVGQLDVTFFYSGTNNGYDRFLSDGPTTATVRLQAEADGTQIGLAKYFNYDVGTNELRDVVKIIDAEGYSGVVVTGSSDHDRLNFTNVEFKGSFEIQGGGGNDVTYLSNVSDGVYRGGSGDDTFYIGERDATFLYSGISNGYDSFVGNNPGQTSRIVVESDDTEVGFATPFNNGVDVIDRGDFTGVVLQGRDAEHDRLDFSDVDFMGTQDFTIGTLKGTDTVTTSLDREGKVRYDGGLQSKGAIDTVHIAVTLEEAISPAFRAELSAYQALLATELGPDIPFTFFSLGGLTVVNFEKAVGLLRYGSASYPFTNVIVGNSNSNTLTGTPEDDLIYGGPGHDIINGLGGNDILIGGADNDTLDGGEGSDVYLVSGTTDGYDVFNDTGVTGTDIVIGVTTGTVIGVRGYNNGVDEFVGQGDTIIRDNINSNTLNFSNTALTGILEVDGDKGRDIITASSLSDGRYRGGEDNDDLIAGDGNVNVTWLYSGDNNGFDWFVNGANHAIAEAETTGTVIGLRGYDNGVDGFVGTGDTIIRDNVNSNTLNFSNTALTGILEVDGDKGRDIITASSLSDGRYRGGADNDDLIAGDGNVNVTWLYSGTDNGYDQFVNGANLAIAKAETEGTVIGLRGYNDGVNEFVGKGDTIIRDNNDTNTLNFSNTALTGILEVDGGRGHDVITASSLSDGWYRGGEDNDRLLAGDGNVTVTWLYSGTDNGYDQFVNGTNLAIAKAETEGTVIGLRGYNDGVDDFVGKGDTIIRDNNDSNTLNFSNTVLTGILEVDGGRGHDVITASSLSDGRYRGGEDNDDLIAGDGNVNVTWLYSGDNNGSDRFVNGSNHAVAVAETTGTVIGLRGYNNGVKEFVGKGDTIIRDNIDSHTLNFSETTLTGISLLEAGNGNDTVTTSLSRLPMTYDGGNGSDRLNFSLTLEEAANPTVQADITNFLNHLATNGPTVPYTFNSLEGITVVNFESTYFPLAVTGAGHYRIVRDKNGAGTADDQLVIYRDTGSGEVELARRLVTGTASVEIVGASGKSDSLTIDYSGGNPIPAGGLLFNGLNGSGTDTLSIVNGNHTTTNYTFENNKSGSVTVDGSVITYKDIEQPINTTSKTTNAVFNLPESGAAVSLRELPDEVAELSGSAIVGVRIVEPSGSLIVNGDDNDGITVSGPSPLSLSSASLTLNGRNITFNTDVSAKNITLNASSVTSTAVTFGTAGSLTASGGNIYVGSVGGISFGNATLTAANIDLSAGGAVGIGTVTSGSFKSTGSGGFDLSVTGSINASGPVQIDHYSVTFRGPVTGSSIDVSSQIVNSTSINSAAATLTATTGDIHLTADNGGIAFGSSALVANNGSVNLLAKGAIGVKTVTAQNFSSSGSGTFDMAATEAAITVAGDVTIHHQGVTFRGPVTGSSIDVSSQSVNSTSINSAAATLTATTGDIHLTADNGGIAFGSSALVAEQGSVILSAAGAIGVKTVNAGNFSSSGSGTFDMAATGAAITVAGDVTIHHQGVTFRGPVTGSSIDVSSQAVNSTSINSAAATLTATTGDIHLTADYGGISFGSGALVANNGSVNLSAKGAIGVKTVNAGNFSSSGSSTFDMAATGAAITVTGDVVIDHTGTITVRGPISGASILLDSKSIVSGAINVQAAGTLTSTGNVTVVAGGGVSIGSNVTVNGPAGVFSSKGTSFSAQDIVVGEEGSIVLTHSGTMNLYGTLDAGTYIFTETNPGDVDVNIRGTAKIRFYVDVQSPPETPLLTLTGGGDLQFSNGSQVEIITANEPEPIDVWVNLVEVKDGGTVVNSGFTWSAEGPGVDAVDAILADGEFLKVLLNH
jgi:hypothetical protein